MRVIHDRRKTLTLTDSIEHSLSCHKWTHDDGALSDLRHLKVEKLPSSSLTFQGHRPYEDEYKDFVEGLEPFNRFISRLQNLKSLTWNAGPVTHTLLQTLHKHHPKAVLKIFCFERWDSSLDHLDESETALSTYPTLKCFRASGGVSHRDLFETPPQYSFATFKSIVANSQSINYAGILLPGCIGQVDFLQSEEDLLKVSTTRKKCRSLKALTLDGPRLQLSKDLLIELDKHIEISNLESVKLSRGLPEVGYFENAATLLPKLKDISLNFSAIRGEHPTQIPLLKAANDYILTCAPLRTLSLWGWTRVISLRDLINRHGRTLTSLHLHEREEPRHSADLVCLDVDDAMDEDRERGLSLLDVQLIKRNCPNLQDLSIDVARHGSFDLQEDSSILQLLDELADSGSQLRKLQIYFTTDGLAALFYPQSGTGNSSDDEETKSYASVLELVLQEYVRSIWNHLYGGTSTGERLLDVKFGEWESKADAFWRQSRFRNGSVIIMCDVRRYFEVRPHERDDHVGECEIRMRKK